VLAQAYSNGHGVPRDFTLSYKWANLAAVMDYPGAAALRDTIEARMTPAQIGEAQKLSSEFERTIA
jgi:TPR repeat protein